MMCFENDDDAGKSANMNSSHMEAIFHKEPRLYQSLEALNEENINAFMNDERNPRTIRFSKEHDKKIRQVVKEKFGSEAAKKIKAIQDQRNRAADEEAGKRGADGFYFLNPRFKKVIAAVLIVFLITGITMSTEAFRQPIVKLFMDIQKEFMGVTADETIYEIDKSAEDSETIEKVYTLGKVQQGYHLVSKEINLLRNIRWYEHNGQLTYRFVQQPHETVFYYDNEKTEVKTVETIFGETVFYDGFEMNYLVWFYDGYRFEIIGNLIQEDLIALAESLVIETGEE